MLGKRVETLKSRCVFAWIDCRLECDGTLPEVNHWARPVGLLGEGGPSIDGQRRHKMSRSELI